ncbi:contractile injection system tape measure protein [Algoriphagus sp. C2-6-M1]|uniref:contractile injection system tape measure protein n=1 Tax=Algoriphagus persicinus TaxID=3108754 RepID=UPI002B3A62FD|nr:contractile injection system tape measure protein [Algoriphagus sp. C2-6-M1]MEB2782572.1 contractile injection system tape measure protein [Algoriphagus sp. C2-6-M1]
MGSHLIQTQVIEAEFRDKHAALEGQKLLQERYNKVLMPVLEQILDEYDPISKSLRIDKLELDLGRIPADLPKDLMRNRFRDTLEDQLRKFYVEQGFHFPPSSKTPLAKSHSSTSEAKNSTNWELFEYFLHFGRFPWWGSTTDNLSVNELLISVFKNQKSLIQPWLEKKVLTYTMAHRMATILSEKQFESIIRPKFPASFQHLGNLEIILKHLTLLGKTVLHFRLKSMVLYSLFGKSSEFSSHLEKGLTLIFTPDPKLAHEASLFICELAFILNQDRLKNGESLRIDQKKLTTLRKNPKLASLLQGNVFWKAIVKELQVLKDKHQDLSTFPELLKKQERNEKSEQNELLSKAPELDETIIVTNAGLVLTAAFLPRFFEKLGLVKAGKFISGKTQSKAVFLLQAMLGSDDVFDESDLTLNKLLCGLLPAAALEPIPKISKSERQEIDLLLESMSTQWTALKSNSGKMIAEGFFRREGALRRVHKGYQLQIQRLPFDLLLDRLPWTIGMIKLPWMEDLIYVEW